MIFDENKYKLMYMKNMVLIMLYVVTFYKLNFNENDIHVIKKMLDCFIDKDYICRKHGHFTKECHQNKNSTNFKKILINNNLCSRCYRRGHKEYKCFTKTTIYNDKIYDDELNRNILHQK